MNKNGLPIYNFDYSLGPGGYGLFQITGDAESNLINIPRKQIWNWQDNVRAVVPILDAKKHRQEVSVIHFGVPLRGDYRFKNKTLTKEAWGIIVNYNGNSGNPYHRAVKYGVPWYYRGNQWRFYDNKQHYAEQVAGHLD